jgi:hypothetical protein
MEDSKLNRSAALKAAAIALIAVLILPPCYLLSIGPALWLMDNGHLTPRVYLHYVQPALFARRRCEPLDAAMNWYLSFWFDAQPIGDQVIPEIG